MKRNAPGIENRITFATKAMVTIHAIADPKKPNVLRYENAVIMTDENAILPYCPLKTRLRIINAEKNEMANDPKSMHFRD